MTPRLAAGDVACWVLKSAALPDLLVPGWAPGEDVELARCVRPSYRLDLLTPGDPCLLWCSGRVDPGVHATGVLVGPGTGSDGGPVVHVRWHRLARPVPREALLADPVARTAEVIRMPAGSNPSWLSAAQWQAVQALPVADPVSGARPR